MGIMPLNMAAGMLFFSVDSGKSKKDTWSIGLPLSLHRAGRAPHTKCMRRSCASRHGKLHRMLMNKQDVDARNGWKMQRHAGRP
jgi:hypothetical protein